MEQKIITIVNDCPFQKHEVGETYAAAGNGDNRELDSPSCPTTNHGGECYCGDIRYRISGEPVIQLYCFCEDCHSIAGTDGYHTGYMVKESDFHLTRGTPATHEELSKEGRTIKRHYCPNCGSHLWAQTDLGLLSVSAGTFDDPGVFHSTKKVFVHDAPDWARAANELLQQQGLSSKESRNDEDDTDLQFESVDLVLEPVPQNQDSCADEDDTDLEFKNVDLVFEPVPQNQDSRADEDDTDLNYESRRQG
jgi:hypothetical protein